MSARIGAMMTMAVAALLSGCLERELSPLNPCAQQGTDQNVRINNVEKVDVLFMIDNSGSMAEEQRALREQLPRLVGVLASGDLEFGRPEEPGFGAPDFDPVRDLHVGVISSDMGTGGFNQMTCDEPVFGDDAVLQNRGNPANDPNLNCLAQYDRFLSFSNPSGTSCTPDENGVIPAGCQQFADAFQCISALGTGGCGFEQQLEAILKALIPDTPECTQPYCNFFNGQRGQGADSTTNGGFLRDDSLLAILVLTDEEDCSAQEPDLFNSRSSRFFGNLNLRCTTYADTALHPIERYVDGLLSLRNDPRLLVFSVIAGVPVQLVRDTTNEDDDGNFINQDFDAMLASNTLTPRPNAQNTGLIPSCSSSNGEADPPRRFVQVARGLDRRGASAIVQSICQADYAPAVDTILQKIAQNLGGTCLPRPLNPDAAGRVNCNVVELLPATGDVTRCDQVPAPAGAPDNGRTRIGAEGGRELCLVTQVPATNREIREDRAGWFYDDFTVGLSRSCDATEQQRISYIPDSSPVTGTEVRLQCLQSVQDSAGGGDVSVEVGTPCNPYEPAECTSVTAPNFSLNNICDPSSRSCQPRCESTADCAPGFLCDNARLGIGDTTSPIYSSTNGGACDTAGGELLDPVTDQCVRCPAPYSPRVADSEAGEQAVCVRSCDTAADCAFDGIAGWGECLNGRICSLPRTCVNPTCE